MIINKMSVFNNGNIPVKENPNTELLSGRIDTLVRGLQARINLLSGLSRIGEFFDSNEYRQQIDIKDKKAVAT